MPQLGDLSPAASVAVGIIVGLLSTSIQSIGLTLQRKSHLLEDEKEDELIRRPPYRRRRWQLGMLMFVIANLVGSTIQITTLPLPVLSTLQASGLVFNTICASLLLGEPFTRWSFGGTFLVAGGAILIALFGALPEPSHTLDQLLHLLGRTQFILWMIGTALVMVGILALSWILSTRPNHNAPRIRLWRGMSFGSISSILSAHSLLVAKSAVELLVRTIVDRVNQFNRWQSWIILLSLLVLALSQLYFLHRGLKLVSTSVLYPFVFCIYNIIAILDGLIYFNQTNRLPPLHAGLIAVGTVILLSGVLALSWRLEDEEHIGPPPDAHTLLTPGMGIVEDTTTDEEVESAYESPYSMSPAEEEAVLAIDPHEETPLLRNGLTLTPTTKDNAILKITNPRRGKLFRTPSEAEEIWAELRDDADLPITKQVSWSKANKARRASTLTYAPRVDDLAHDSADEGLADDDTSDHNHRPRRRSTSPQGTAQASARRRARTLNVVTDLPPAARSSTLNFTSARPGTGHSMSTEARHRYNQQRRRRWSARYRRESLSASSPLLARSSGTWDLRQSQSSMRASTQRATRAGTLTGWLRYLWRGDTEPEAGGTVAEEEEEEEEHAEGNGDVAAAIRDARAELAKRDADAANDAEEALVESPGSGSTAAAARRRPDD